MSRAEIFLIEITYSKYFEARRFTFCIFKILESTAWRVREELGVSATDRTGLRSEGARGRGRGSEGDWVGFHGQGQAADGQYLR